MTAPQKQLKDGLDILESASQMSCTSIRFENGVEVASEHSYLHRWKPEHNLRKEEYWDRQQHKFACAQGAVKDSGDLFVNKQIIAELEKLKSLYETDKDTGRAMAYRKAITMLKGFKDPIKSAS